MMSEEINSQHIENDEIDLIELIQLFWKGRKTLIWSLVGGVVFGLLFAFASSRQYEVKSVFIPQYSGKSSGSGLSALASMAGVNLGSTGSDVSGEVSPLFYPSIVSSVPFQLELMQVPLHFAEINYPASIYEYLTEYSKPSFFSSIKKYTIGLPSLILSALRPKETPIKMPAEGDGPKIIILSKAEHRACKFLSGAVQLSVDQKKGDLTLTTTLKEPLAAAELAQIAQDLLQKYVIDFKTQKAKQDLGFIQERYDTAKKEMESKQYSAAASSDKTKNLTTTTAQLSTIRSQTDFQIANAVFLDLAKQLEQAKIKVTMDTPTFTIVQPVTIPLEPAGSGKMIKLLAGIMLGVITGISIIYLKEKLPGIKARVINIH